MFSTVKNNNKRTRCARGTEEGSSDEVALLAKSLGARTSERVVETFYLTSHLQYKNNTNASPCALFSLQANATLYGVKPAERIISLHGNYIRKIH